MKKTPFYTRLALFSLVLVVTAVLGAIGLSVAVAAWSGAPAIPPGSNVGAPLNVGTDPQTKQGSLTIQEGSSMYISPNGRFYDDGTYMRYSGPHSFYITGDVTRAYIYSNDIYLGPSSGANVRFRASSLTGSGWSLNATGDLDVSGQIHATGDICTDQGGGICLSSAGTDLYGWSFANDVLYDDSENVIQASDEWLRLNNAGNFTSGVYTPGLMRADGGFQVDGITAIDAANRFHYSKYSTATSRFGTVNTSGFGIDVTNNGDWDILAYEGNVYLQYSNTSGRVYIGGQLLDYNDSIVNIGEDLTVAGEVRATAFWYTSDKTLKENIQPISSSLEKVLQLKGVSFNWKDTGKASIGLISQDVEKIFPEIVSADENGIKSLEYAKLVAPLIEAIKEQQKEIEGLQIEIEKLK